MMNPLEDPRPFFEVLRDWAIRHRLTHAGIAEMLGDPGKPLARTTVAEWLAGEDPPCERQARALMAILDAPKS